MASNRLVAIEGVKRGRDGILAPLSAITFDKGWNVRNDDAELEEHIERIAQSIVNGGKVPPLQVYERDGKLVVVDGHCRTRAYRLAKKKGADVDLVPIIEFIGDDADRVAFMFTSSQGKSLSPYEQSVAFKRLQGFNWSTAEIAKRVGRSVGFVDDMLKLANSDTAVKEMVKSGKVAVTAAVKVVKKEGSKAAAVLKEKHEKANANVKEGDKPVRVTDRHVDKPGLSKGMQSKLIEFFTGLPGIIGEEVYALALPHTGADVNTLDATEIDVNMFSIVQLIRLKNEIEQELQERNNG